MRATINNESTTREPLPQNSPNLWWPKTHGNQSIAQDSIVVQTKTPSLHGGPKLMQCLITEKQLNQTNAL